MILKDSINRKNDLYGLFEFLNSLKAQCSISINGDWGRGKTIFMKQLKLLIDTNNTKFNTVDELKNNQTQSNLLTEINDKNIENTIPQVCVYYDAWQNDNSDDPLLSLIHSIVSDLSSDLKKDKNLLNCGLELIKLITGRDFKSIFSEIKAKSYFKKIMDEKTFNKKVNNFIDKALEERGDRLVLIIDELDRCKPSFAIELLEKIKHFFNNDKITIVYALNLFELKNVIKVYYGENYSSLKYLDRFFDYSFDLSPVDYDRYLSGIGFNSRDIYNIIIRDCVRYFKFTMRQSINYINSFYKIINKTRIDKNSRNPYFIISLFIIPYNLGLRISGSDEYDLFNSGDGLLKFKEFYNFFLQQSYIDYFLPDVNAFNQLLELNKSILDLLYLKLFKNNESHHLFNYFDSEHLRDLSINTYKKVFSGL